MDLKKISELLKSGELIQHGDVLLNKEQHTQYIHALKQEEYFDMLQGVRKVLL